MLIPNYLLSIVCLAANPEVLDQCRRTRWIVRLSNEFRPFALRDRRPLPRRPNRRPSFVLTTARAVSVAMQPMQNHTIQKDEPKSSSSIHRKLRKRSKPVSVSISRRHTVASPSAKCFLSKGKLRDVPDKHGWLGWKEGMCVCVCSPADRVRTQCSETVFFLPIPCIPQQRHIYRPLQPHP